MFRKVCKASDVDEGSLSRFDIDGHSILVTRLGDEYFAADTWCTHERADLSLGMLLEGVITCPLHQAKFDVRQGTVLAGPNGEDPSVIPSLGTYKTRIVEDELWVDL